VTLVKKRVLQEGKMLPKIRTLFKKGIWGRKNNVEIKASFPPKPKFQGPRKKYSC